MVHRRIGRNRRPGVDGTPITVPTSSSMSSRSLGPNATPSPTRRCPAGRGTGVPDTTTVPARPWYATGRCRQLGSSGSASGRNSRPRFVACSIEL